MITKQLLLYELKNFASYQKPATAKSLYEKYREPNQTELQFKRKLASIVKQIQDEQLTNLSISPPTGIIVSSNEGYYIARNREQAEYGVNFYREKVTDMQKRLNSLTQLINKTFPEPEQTKGDPENWYVFQGVIKPNWFREIKYKSVAPTIKQGKQNDKG